MLGVHFSMYMRMIFLKMVSFNVDYYWSEVGTSGAASSWHLKQLERFSEEERDDVAKGGGPYSWREKTARPPSDYNALAYFAFLFFVLPFSKRIFEYILSEVEYGSCFQQAVSQHHGTLSELPLSGSAEDCRESLQAR